MPWPNGPLQHRPFDLPAVAAAALLSKHDSLIAGITRRRPVAQRGFRPQVPGPAATFAGDPAASAARLI